MFFPVYTIVFKLPWIYQQHPMNQTKPGNARPNYVGNTSAVLVFKITEVDEKNMDSCVTGQTVTSIVLEKSGKDVLYK